MFIVFSFIISYVHEHNIQDTVQPCSHNCPRPQGAKGVPGSQSVSIFLNKVLNQTTINFMIAGRSTVWFLGLWANNKSAV